MSRGPLAAIAGVVAVALLATSGRYGYHRDELYFLACGRHPAWGYPDQPPLTPILARLMDDLGHGSLPVFRLPALFAAVGITLLSGLLARELGGGRRAQVLAAIAVGSGLFTLLSGHLLLTSSLDLLVWVTVTWLLVRMLRTGDDRLWLAVGAVIGIGLLNKQLPVVLALGMLAGLLLTPSARILLRSRWLWAGIAIAAVAWAPVLSWQAAHGWPQLTLAREIRAEYGAAGERAGFFALQFVLFSLGATYLWVTGAAHLWRDEGWRRYRVVAWAWLTVLVVVVITAGQAYYPAGTYPALIAAGAVAAERHLRRWWLAVAAVILTSALLLPASLPVLPARTLGGSVLSGPGETQLETVGWPHLVDVVAAAYRSIPEAERAHAGVFTTNYGEAGAVDRYGAGRGLPRAWSGHNGYGLWGPPPADVAPVVVVWEGGFLAERFSGCRLFARITGPVSNEETDFASVQVCAGVIGGWDAAWPHLRHLSS